MKRFCDPVAIHGLGLATGLGASRADTAKAQSSVKSTFRGHKRFYDAAYNPLVCAFADRDVLSGFVPRVTALAQAALLECLGGVSHIAPGPTRLELILPATQPGLAQAGITKAASQIEAQVRDVLGANLVGARVTQGSSAAIGPALAEANQSGVPYTLIIAADSFCDRDRLDAGLSAGQLMSSKTQWGRVPGEAAGACLVGTGTGLAQIAGLGLGQEPVTETDLNRESDFRSISAAVRDACADLGDDRVTHWFADLNNARYRASEIAHAILRATPFWLSGDVMPQSPADTLGDCGVANGLTALHMALNVAGHSIISLSGGASDRTVLRVTNGG